MSLNHAWENLSRATLNRDLNIYIYTQWIKAGLDLSDFETDTKSSERSPGARLSVDENRYQSDSAFHDLYECYHSLSLFYLPSHHELDSLLSAEELTMLNLERN